jgi:hypothetical protein
MSEHDNSERGFDPLTAFDDLPPQVAPVATLERLRDQARKMQELEAEVNEKTVALAEVQAAFDRISMRTIPDIMAELAMESFTMEDGYKLEVKNDLKASITAENKPSAHRWLREHNFDGIIKTKVLAEFGRGELSKAEEALSKLREAGFEASIDEGVHAATLKSFVKERMEAGDAIPVSIFGVYEFKKTKITAPKGAAKKSSKITSSAAPEAIQFKPQVSYNF